MKYTSTLYSFTKFYCFVCVYSCHAHSLLGSVTQWPVDLWWFWQV